MIYFLFTIFLSFFSGPFSTGFAETTEPIDIVFDLDWTLIYETTQENADLDPSNIIKYKGDIYRFSDHAVQVISRLQSTPGFRVSFFSGGDKERNLTVLNELYQRINIGRNPPDFIQPYKILNADDLTSTGEPASAKFSERYKKDLKALGPKINLNRTILVDDSKDFSPLGQEQNMLWLQKTYNDITDWESRSAKTPIDDEYQPKSQTDWALERNKLAWVLGVLLLAKEESSATGESFVEAVGHLTRDKEGNFRPRDSADQLDLFKKGLRALDLSETQDKRFSQFDGMLLDCLRLSWELNSL